jgi:FkbM family methyltransferase
VAGCAIDAIDQTIRPWNKAPTLKTEDTPPMFSYQLVRKSKLAALQQQAPAYFELELLKAVPPQFQAQCLALFPSSRSQLRQDVFVLGMSGFKRQGFFVEFGATNGLDLSNKALLEQNFGWTGILAEPARQWHTDLHANRSAVIDTRCVWRESGAHLDFTEAPRGENSGLTQFMKKRRQIRGNTYSVETITLTELLQSHGAPQVIDYLSIDTEGSEFDILKAFDFDSYRFRVITVEHNFAPQRSDIYQILTEHGYRRVAETASRFDDWYVHPDA